MTANELKEASAHITELIRAAADALVRDDRAFAKVAIHEAIVCMEEMDAQAESGRDGLVDCIATR